MGKQKPPIFRIPFVPPWTIPPTNLRQFLFKAATGLAMTLCLFALDCRCDDEAASPCSTECPEDQYCCFLRAQCEPIQYKCTNLSSCQPGFELSYPDPPFMNQEECVPLDLTCECKPSNQLSHGIIGRYSALATTDETLVASGYENTYGDLVLISAPLSDLSKQTKEIVDGVPDTAPTKDKNSWRGGVIEAGDDVGKDTDIVVNSQGALFISYFDVTHRSLKMAVKSDGKWSTHTVDAPQESQVIIGRFTAMTLLSDKPAIAYLALNLKTSASTFKSELRFAKATKEIPSSSSDWTISTVESAPMPCQGLCGSNEACVLNTDGSSACAATSDKCDKCADGEACISGTCKTILADAPAQDLPLASGLFPSIAIIPSGPLIVYYDRVNGDLNGAALVDDNWKVSTIKGDATNDFGAYCSTSVDAGNIVHIAYQDAKKMSLNYLQFDSANNKVLISEVIDDGSRKDGQHPVGADNVIFMDQNGKLRVIYQDAETISLLQAERSGLNKWTPVQTDDKNLGRALLAPKNSEGFGFYSDLIIKGSKIYGSTFTYNPTDNPRGSLVFFEVQ